MAIKKRSEDVDLTLIDDQQTHVILNVTIGNAQIGGSLVKWKHSSDILKKGKIVNLDLGNIASIKGKTLTIITNVLDDNEQTNGVVVTYFFQNCNPAAKMFNDTVDADGDIFQLKVDFTFN